MRPPFAYIASLLWLATSYTPLAWAASPLGVPAAVALAPSPAPAEKQNVRNALVQLPLAFEPNRGQAPEGIAFLARAPGYLLQLTATEALLFVRGETPNSIRSPHISISEEAPKLLPHALKLTWLGADANVLAAPESSLPGKVNYLKDPDPANWRTDIPTYERVRYSDLYPGIDLVYYGNGRTLEYDLIVAPGADPDTVRFAIEGAEVRLTDNGDLILALSDSRAFSLKAPLIYQERDGEKLPVEGRYRVLAEGARTEIGFEVAAYDRTLPLVIDPLVYSTFLGGSSFDYGYGIAVNDAGEAFVTGYTSSADFPTTGGAYNTARNGSDDVFVTRLNATGTALVYSTYLGGSGDDRGYGIAVNSANEAFVTGFTDDAATDFPTTAGAFSTAHNGVRDAFVVRLNSAGSALVYSTFLGGSGNDYGQAIAANSANEVFVTGYTNDAATDFPTTAGAFDTTHNGVADAFVTRLPTPTVAQIGAGASVALIYSTYIGGSGNDEGNGIAVNSANEAFVVGDTDDHTTDFPTTVGAFSTAHNGGVVDVFVSRLNATGTVLVYSTFLGGSGADYGYGIAINSANEVFVTGYTRDAATDFPVTAGAFDTTHNGGTNGFDAFVARLNATGTALVYSTFLGGSGDDVGYAIVINADGEAFVTGYTYDDVTDFPVTAGAFDTTHNAGTVDVFVCRLNRTGTALVYSTFLGGSGDDYGRAVAVNSSNEAFVTGYTFDAATDFPTTAGAYDTTHNSGYDVFVTKVATGAPADGGDTGGPSIGAFINDSSSSEVIIAESPQGAAVRLEIEVNEIEGKELFFVLNAPALGINWSYLNNKNQWVPVPANWAAIRPFRLAPANGRHSLFGTQTLPAGTYEFYLGFDERVDGFLNIVAGGVLGKFVQRTVQVQ